MHEFVKVLSDSAPYALLGAFMGLVAIYLQFYVKNTERRLRHEDHLKLEHELRMKIKASEAQIEELRKQLAVTIGHLNTTTVEKQDPNIARLADELASIRKQILRREGTGE